MGERNTLASMTRDEFLDDCGFVPRVKAIRNAYPEYLCSRCHQPILASDAIVWHAYLWSRARIVGACMHHIGCGPLDDTPADAWPVGLLRTPTP